MSILEEGLRYVAKIESEKRQGIFFPTTQDLLNFGFHTSDLRNYARHCERGEITYSRDENRFYAKEHFKESFRPIRVSDLEEMKAHVWAMNEPEA